MLISQGNRQKRNEVLTIFEIGVLLNWHVRTAGSDFDMHILEQQVVVPNIGIIAKKVQSQSYSLKN